MSPRNLSDIKQNCLSGICKFLYKVTKEDLTTFCRTHFNCWSLLLLTEMYFISIYFISTMDQALCSGLEVTKDEYDTLTILGISV